MINLLNSSLKLLLVIAIAFGPFGTHTSFAESSNKEIKAAVSDVVAAGSNATTEVVPHPQNPAVKAEISVTHVATQDQSKILKEVAEQAQGPVIILHAPKDAAKVEEALRAAHLSPGQEIKVVELPVGNAKSWRESVKDKWQSFKQKFQSKKKYFQDNKKEIRSAVLINFAINVGVAPLTFYMTQDVADTVGIAAVFFITSTLRTVFTETWLKYLNGSGRIMSDFSKKVAGAFDAIFRSNKGHDFINAHEDFMRITGKIFGASFVASASFLAAQAVTGELSHVSFLGLGLMALLGMTTAYDYVLFDVAGAKLYEKKLISFKTYQRMIQVANVYGPTLDAVFVSAPHLRPVKYLVFFTDAVAVVAAYQGEKLLGVLSSSSEDTLKSINSIRAKAMKSINSFRQKTNDCEAILAPQRYDSAGRIPYEDAA